MQINRLLDIIYTLLNEKTVTAQKLADRFEVSRRTIYRDIDILSLSGIPVYTEKGKGGGISLLPGFVLDKSLLNEQEQSEILSALHGLSAIKPVKAEQILNKLSVVFNRDIVNWVDVDFSDWSCSGSDIFYGLKEAILNKNVVEFDYYSTSAKKMRRRMEPLQLWFKSKSWYVKGFCLLRQDVRLFKLTRMKNLTVTNESFRERKLTEKSPTAKEHPKRRTAVTVKLKILPEMAYRVYDEFDENQVIAQDDGNFMITTTWPEDDWVYGTILSFGEWAEVLEPEYMRQLIKEKAKKIYESYL